MTAPTAITITTSALPAPRWATREDALAYLRGDLSGWLRAAEDLNAAGVRLPPMLMEDLAEIADGLGEFLEADGQRRVVPDDVLAGESVGDWQQTLAALRAVLKPGGLCFTGADGLGGQCLTGTLSLLARAHAHAVEVDAENRLAEAELALQKFETRVHAVPEESP